MLICVRGGVSIGNDHMHPSARGSCTAAGYEIDGAEARGGATGNEPVGMARLTAGAWRTSAADAAGGL